ncbi:MAG: MerR family transcriptional regulator [Hyphomicrobiales bacterium]|nr:MerR family transcriptional regulator [Hyphomicrobiales bacterium]MDE2017930.1 MerR family transcriptional regulator [Hyphomicrobiales bacterium]
METALRNDGADVREPTREALQSEFLTIGEMARGFSVSLRALRFYEDRGLLKPHRIGTQRLYGARERFRLRMILKGKSLGFTLTEIRALIGARAPDGEQAAEFEDALGPNQVLNQISHLERQRDQIERAIADLRATHEKMSRHAA